MSTSSNKVNVTEEILQQLQANKANVTLLIAQKLLDERIEGYANFSLSQLSQSLRPTIDMIFQYFRDGNTVPPKVHIVHWAEMRVKAGFSLESLEKAVNMCTYVLEDQLDLIIASYLDNPNIAKTDLKALQTKFKIRLESLQALCQVKAVNSALNPTH